MLSYQHGSRVKSHCKRGYATLRKLHTKHDLLDEKGNQVFICLNGTYNLKFKPDVDNCYATCIADFPLDLVNSSSQNWFNKTNKEFLETSSVKIVCPKSYFTEKFNNSEQFDILNELKCINGSFYPSYNDTCEKSCSTSTAEFKVYSEKLDLLGWTLTNKKEKFVHKEQVNYICGDTPLIVNQNSSNVTDVKKSTIERGPEQIQLECFNKNLYLTKKFILSKFFLLDEHYNSAYVCAKIE